MTPKLPVMLKNGELKFQPTSKDYIRAQKDGWYLFTLTKPKSNRTNQMNSYYWGVMIKMIAEETGYDDDQVHVLMKQQFGVYELLSIDTDAMLGGVDFEGIPKSTAKYTVEEMQEYWLKIMRWAAEFLNLQIPEPGEVDYE